MNDLNKVIGGILGVGLGLYTLKVVFSGNTDALGNLLKDETGYLEFLVALYALYLLHKYGPEHKIIDLIITMAVLAIIFKTINRNTTLVSNTHAALSKFGSGNATILETIGSILGYKAS